MPPLDWAGAQHSQSPIGANDGAVIESVYAAGSMHAAQYCSLSKIKTLPGRDDQEIPTAVDSKSKGGSQAALRVAHDFLVIFLRTRSALDDVNDLVGVRAKNDVLSVHQNEIVSTPFRIDFHDM